MNSSGIRLHSEKAVYIHVEFVKLVFHFIETALNLTSICAYRYFDKH